MLLLCALSPTLASAQASDLGNWMIYFGNKKIDNKWNWHHEVQYRNYNAIGDLEQLLLRTGMGYNLTEDNNNLLLGWAYVLSENYIGSNDRKVEVREHRIYQQFITKQQFGRVGLQHRYRFEQRWIEDNFRLRLRYFISTNIALNSSKMTDGTFYLSAYNEVFLNTRATVFDRNRFYIGLGYRLNKMVRFEVGQMKQTLNNGVRNQLNLIAFVNF
jgi:hypothetical protein